MAIVRKAPAIPFWRDVRILGVLAQIAFVFLVILAARWIGGNLREGLQTLGRAQFVCRDGSSRVICAFDFMGSAASFDISESVVEYEVTDSYWYALWVGVLNTVKVAALGILLATILGTLTGIARLSRNGLISNLAKGYIEVIRNTPLLVQLFFIYFGIVLQLPPVGNSIRPLGLPIYLNQRGVSLPWPVFTPSFSTWLAFVILGLIQSQVLWILLGRREERTGRPGNRAGWALFSFLLVVTIGWFVTTATAEHQGLLTARASRIREFEDIQTIMLNRTGLDSLDEIDTLSQEELAQAALKVCVLRDSPSEANFTAQLRQGGIPYQITRADRADQATQDYAEGRCEVFAAPRSFLAGERGTLENPDSHLIVSIQERPVVVGVPAREGLNVAGGAKMTPEFAALLFGLVIYTAAFIAEIVRAGILAVSKGQTEAARALGLTESQRLQLVVLPQALRVIIPPLTSEYLSLTKNSSLAIAIGFPDLYSVAYTTLNQSGRAIQLILIVMVAYLATSLATSALLNWYNERVKLVER